jgi:hypothetical protein
VLYLLLAVALCLLVPWLPVLMYRRLPRLPPPPVSDWELQRLASELRPGAPEGPTEVLDVEGGTGAAVTPAAGAAPTGRGQAEPRIEPADGRAAPAPAGSPPRLKMGPYRWVNIAGVPAFVVTMLASALGWAALLHVLGEARARSFGPAVFLFKPFAYGVICVLPAIFLGIFTTLPVLALLARLVLGRRRFREYLFWDEGRLASGGTPAEGVISMLAHLAVFSGVLSAGFVVLVMNWYARFTEEEIAIKRLLAVREEAHLYGSVVQVVLTTHAKQGRDILEREDVHLRFADGKTWDTDATFFLPRDATERQRFLDFLQAKTGKPIVRARLLTDVPGW